MLPNAFTLKFVEPDGDVWYDKKTYYSSPEHIGTTEVEEVVITLTKKDNKVFLFGSDLSNPTIIKHKLQTDTFGSAEFFSEKKS